MCGQNVTKNSNPTPSGRYLFFQIATFLLFLFIPLAANARKTNFNNSSGFGLGFRYGLEERLHSDLVTNPKTKNSFSSFYSFEPTFVFDNFALLLSVTLHDHPLVNGSGADSTGNFTESSDAYTLVYGGSVLFIPFVSESKTARGYFFMGGGLANIAAKNSRTYENSTVYAERLHASTEEFHVGFGFEHIFVQNYSLSLDFGHRDLKFRTLEYSKGSSDLSGNTHTSGEPARQSNGTIKEVDLSGFYASLGLALHF